MTRVEQIAERLKSALEAERVEIEDESALHAGHAGARGGAGHYRVVVVSARFAGLDRVSRHRLVYDALADMIPAEIHAISAKALTPEERGAE